MNESAYQQGAQAIKSAINQAATTSPEFQDDDRSRIEATAQAQKEIARNLPPIQRQQFLENLQRIQKAASLFQEQKTNILWIIENLRKNQIPEQDLVINSLEKELEALTQNFSELFTTAISSDFLFAVSQKSTRDQYTGLLLRTALFDEVRRTVLEEWLDNPEKIKLSNYEIWALDMENFKVGNDILGHDKFDVFIAQMAGGFISTSQHLAANDPEAFMNQPYPPGKPEQEQTLNYYFPEGSLERRMLEEAKTKGILIEFYRDKAGGDEAIIFVKYAMGKSNQNRQLVQEIVENIFEKSQLPKHNQADLNSIQEKALNFPNQIKFHRSELNEIRRLLGLGEDVSDAQLNSFIDYFNKLADFVRRVNESNVTKIINDETCCLQMGATIAEADLDQAMSMFLFGLRPDGTYKETGGILNLDGEVNPDKLKQYENHIASNVELLRRAMGIEDVGLIEDLIKSEATSPITGQLLAYLFHEVEVGKKYRKTATIIDALEGDEQKLYQLGASEKASRFFQSDLPSQTAVTGQTSSIDTETKLVIFLSLEKYFGTLYGNMDVSPQFLEYNPEMQLFKDYFSNEDSQALRDKIYKILKNRKYRVNIFSLFKKFNLTVYF